jgi:signal transduction histidine kinase
MEPLGGFANFGAEELARRTLSSVRSARRWIREGLAPRLIVWCLRIMFDAPLGELSREWDGWSLRDGKLHSPEGTAFTPHEIRALPLRLQQLSALERAIERIRDERRERVHPQRRQPRRRHRDGIRIISHEISGDACESAPTLYGAADDA